MIQTAFIPFKDVLEIVPPFVQDGFGIDKTVVKKQMESMMSIMRKNLLCFVEYPYVDKFHRDSYYSFYSKKHNAYQRDSIRISYFFDDIDPNNYFEYSKQELEKLFVGFITIRPTTYRIIGHSFIDTRGLLQDDVVCCLTSKTVSLSGRKISVRGFPYCSQDNESITCSETTIINLMDYFSHQYAEYSTILASDVAKILSKVSYERQLPSKGLPTESISYVLKKMGFGAVVYSGSLKPLNDQDLLYDADEFKQMLLTYVESGIPIIATLSDIDSKEHHAIIVVGRKEIKGKISVPRKRKLCGGSILYQNYFVDSVREVVVMNDNVPPYEVVDILNPKSATNGTNLRFTSFVAPLYSKVFVDSFQFKSYFALTVENLKTFEATRAITILPKDQPYVLRFFLTSSKSYKEYIATSKGLSADFKTVAVNISTPKFLWIAEVTFGSEAGPDYCVNSMVVVDATESGLYGHLIWATDSRRLITRKLVWEEREDDSSYKVYDFGQQKFTMFATNLKGRHTHGSEVK